ncbi:MAG: tRNA (N6-isopentenyl adenosine(37)-C2)-methylthiotransferase MiaB [Erysipelotrichaceae bacterium]|nr:tRNA (N6-isopentenyl adenosine(37)-C2)-methylthiotransferase MiaB [Erysipelotrichaceae bacterium]
MNRKKENYILPDQKLAARRSGKQADIERDMFHLGEDAAMLGQGKKYYIRTYGCQANVRDGETMAGMMELMGYTRTEIPEEGDVLIFNTCAVRAAAEERVLGEIGSLKPWKNAHKGKIIALCGCMAQEEAIVRRVLDSYRQVDLIFGTHNIHRLPDLLHRASTSGERVVEVLSEEGKIIEDLPVKRTSSCKGYVNIMYGCNKFCTYCIVPYTRGRERSRQQEDIIREIAELKNEGAKEVILLGQNVNAYGKDLKIEDGFTKLLEAAAETGIERIRFYTSHPRDYSITTIEAMRKYPNIMPSLHLPVQSGNDEILRRMARGYSAGSYRKLVDEMKERIPDITFTTDLIVGFPGETEEQFRDTLDLVDYCRFDMAYSFVYSPREGTPAAKMEDSIPLEVKKERLQILNQKLSGHASANNAKYLGQRLKVLCEGRSKKNENMYAGYSEHNKLVNFSGPEGLEGEIVEVEITAVHSFSLDGKAVVNPV